MTDTMVWIYGAMAAGCLIAAILLSQEPSASIWCVAGTVHFAVCARYEQQLVQKGG